MKIRRIIAGLLAFAMVVTSSPLENMGVVKAEENVTKIAASDINYMHFSDTVKVNNGYLSRQNSDGMRNDEPFIETLRGDVIEQFNVKDEEWHWFAYRINVPTEGTYTLGVETSGCKYESYSIPLCINNEVYTLSYSAKSQTVTTNVTLPVGEHIVVMFAPMPISRSSSDLKDNIWNDYPWCDVKSIIVDKDLTVIKNEDKELTDEQVKASFYSRVEAGNTTYATPDCIPDQGGYKLDGNNAKDPARSKVAQTWNELATSDGKLNYLAKESLPYVQYVVDAEEEGSYYLNVGYQFGGTATSGMDYTTFAVIVNDDVYKIEHKTNSSNMWANQTIAVQLKNGRNVIRTTGILKDTGWYNANAWLNHDYIAIESGAEFVPVNTTAINGGDETKVIFNKFKDNGTFLGNVSAGDMRVDKPTIDTLPYAGNLIERWPYVAVKVTAEKTGYYDITVNATVNTDTASPQLGILVDGMSYSKPFKKVSPTAMDTSMYLTAGEHVIIFFIPMPALCSDTFESNATYYSWMDYNSITFGTGIKNITKPTIEEVKSHLGSTLKANDETKVLINRFTDGADKLSLSNTQTNDLKNNRISLESLLKAGFDKSPYVAYKVEVAKEGNYEVCAKVMTRGADLASPQFGVVVDGTEVYTATLNKSGKLQLAGTTVHLTAGTHTILLTSPMPATDAAAGKIKDPSTDEWKDMNYHYPWFDVAELYISSGTSFSDIYAKESCAVLEMEDTEYVKYSGDFKIQAYPGASDGNALVGENISTQIAYENAEYYDWNGFNGVEFAVNATQAGSYTISLGMMTTYVAGNMSVDTPSVLIYANGAWKTVEINKWNSFEELSLTVYLKEGINIIKCMLVVSDVETARVVFDYVGFDTGKLTAVEVSKFTEGSLTYNVGDEVKILANKYVDNGDTLGGADLGDARWSKYYIKGIKLADLSRVPYAAMKVNAVADGYYDIIMEAGTNTADKASSQIAFIIDGKVYALSFSKTETTTLSATVYLEQGTHLLIFTSPMPKEKVETGDSNTHPWFNMNKFTFSKGLVIEEKPSVEELDYAEVVNVVDGIVKAGDDDRVLPNHYTDAGDTLGAADSNQLKNNRVSIETLLEKGFDKAPFASFNVEAKENGTYDIYAMVVTDAKLTSKYVAVLVDRETIIKVPVKAIAESQMIHVQVPLVAGTHNILFTAPLPETDAEAQAIPSGDSDGWIGMNGAYRWMNYITFAVDKELVVLGGIADAHTDGLETSDETYVGYRGAFQNVVFPGASSGNAIGGNVINSNSKITKNAKYYDWGQVSYLEFAVEAKKAGEYKLTFNVIAMDKLPSVLVYANAEYYKTTLSESANEFVEITVPVKLKKGTNVVRVMAVADKTDGKVFFDDIQYDKDALSAVTIEKIKDTYTIVNAGDETKVLAGHYKDNGDTLGDGEYGDLQWDKLSLDVLTYDNLKRIPYAAIKVSATEDGYYDIGLGIGAYKSDLESVQIGLLLDGKEVHVLGFEKIKNPDIHATIYLTKGTHTLVFTSPMPADKQTAATTEKFDKLAYPWLDMATIMLGEGLKIKAAPMKEEIEAPFYNRIEAEDEACVLYNNYNAIPEENKDASSGYVIGGQMRWLFEQTFDELAAWTDAKHNSYIEYAVMAPEDGEYNIRVGFLAGSKNESVNKPYIAVIANGKAQKVQFTKDWLEIEKAELTVNLKKGLNIIRCTSYTVDQKDCYDAKAWINHDFLDIDKRLAAVKRNSVKVEAENSKFFNKLTVQNAEEYEKASSKVLGKADRKYVSGLEMTLDKLTIEQLKQIPYFSFTVNAPEDGYYPMSLDMSSDGRMPKGTIGLIVDGIMKVVKYNRTGKTVADGRVDALVYMAKGEHVLTFTIPMPADDKVEVNYSYCWANFDSLTLYDGLTLAKIQKAPTEEADYVKIEVEEHAMYNLNKNNGTAAGNAYYKVSQSTKEMLKVGIDGEKTPYAELTVRASEAGEYTLYLGTSYGMTEGCTKDETVATFVVDVNDKLQTKSIQASKHSTWTVVPITVNLEKGKNVVRLTHLGSDSQCGGTTWIDFDYIEMSPDTASKLEFVKTSLTLEAEEGNFVGYATQSDESYSNKQYLGEADYGYIDENDVTFENLKADDLDEIPRVTYTFEAEKAGTYTLSVGFSAGLYKFTTEEMAEGRKGGFAVVVNGTSKQLVEYDLCSASQKMTRLISVELQEGENEITVTTTLADYIIGHTPRDDEKYRLIWMDQDYLLLSEGLSRGAEPEKYGLEDSDYNHAQITLGTFSDKNDKEKDEKESLPIPLIVGGLAAIGLVTILVLVILLKKKEKGE